MNASWIIAVFVIIDDVMSAQGHQSHRLAQVPDSEVLTVAVVAAKYFQNHHELTLSLMKQLGYLSGALSISRFNRRLHKLEGWLPFFGETLASLVENGEVFVIDSLPLPVCRRVRAWRCRKVRGRIYCGYCAAKDEKFFGWRLHLICTPAGVPVRFTILPASLHDLTPIHELTADLPEGAAVFGDKAYNSADDEASIFTETGVRLVPIRKVNMQPNDWADDFDLRRYRHSIETTNSQLAKMGIERLHARTNPGFEIKVHASLLALACSNLD
jgi:hypothetical protein